MEHKPSPGMTLAQSEAARRRDVITEHAWKVCKQAKKQAEEACNQAQKNANDKQAKMQAEEALKAAIALAEKQREATLQPAHAAFHAVWREAENIKKDKGALLQIPEAAKRRDEAIAQAWTEYEKTAKQAEQVHQRAKKEAHDKQVKAEAEEAYKKTIKQAEELRDAIIDKALQDYLAVTG